jgi:tetratricopeptide (TPR) repeat protein
MHFERRVAATAALAMAAYWILPYFEGELLLEPLLTILLLVAVVLLTAAWRACAVAPRKARRGALREALRWGAPGVVLGLAAITRPNALLLLPFIAGWMLWRRRRGGELRRGAREAAFVTLGCFACVAPVTVRNVVRGHDMVLIASQGGLNLWIGNNPGSDGRTARLPPGGERDFGVSWAERESGRPLEASEVSRFYSDRALRFVREHPARALELTVLKFRLWWSRYEIGNDENIYFWCGRFAPDTMRLPVRFAFAGPIAILGIAWAIRRRASELALLWGVPLVYMASFLPFFSCARFRMPVVPFLLLLAGYGAFEFARAIRERASGRIAAGTLVLALGALLVNATPHAEPGDRDFISWVTLGNVYADRGEAAAALESYRAALRIAPGDLQATAGLGNILGTQGRLPEGIAAYRAALAGSGPRRAGDSEALVASIESNLANALAMEQDYAGAVEHYRRAIALAPAAGQGSDQLNLGLVLEALGRTGEARDSFRAALEVNPGLAPARAALARIEAAGLGDREIPLRIPPRAR